jgi:hypothetical protein
MLPQLLEEPKELFSEVAIMLFHPADPLGIDGKNNPSERWL